MINRTQRTNPLTETKDFFLRELEFNDPVDGSNHECFRYDQDEIEEHNRNLLAALEADQMQTLIKAFPEEYCAKTEGAIVNG